VLLTTCAVPSTGSFIRIALKESPSSPTAPESMPDVIRWLVRR
jgi:hypothetical protein